ncbi:hypothetical protein FOJ82_10965 [Tessaracoccus rhinocerotis]|uniref:Uncharacterized protein n=1 Tax=Tessaracoccus rhinocerotis TaxID=1689449 RepID=A0A553JZE6_9ACTN|nr:glycosyltransferase [Tessaracoccus rhinocerotis]TRY17787.1 hypothetical protein FOJ82_10965 [Tessaracoccus rhinocerotis]
MMFVGATRFSLYQPNSDLWLASNGAVISPDEYLAFLYDDARMAPRCDIFLTCTLPMLALAAEGHDVRHVVSFSDNLPEVYRSQLLAAAERFDFVVLDEVPVGTQSLDLAQFGRDFSRELGVEGQPYGQYRLDDDDVLACDFFDQMVPHIIPEHVGWVVTLAKGVTAIYRDGKFYFAKEAILPLHSKGHLAVVQWFGGDFITPPTVPHNASDRYTPVVLDSRRFSHLWVRSTIQDGALHQLGVDEHEQAVMIQNKLGRMPGVSQSVIDEIFPLLAGRLLVERVPGL